MSIAFLLGLVLLNPVDDTVKTEFVSEGVTAKVGGYRPIRSDLGELSDDKAVPNDLSQPKYGEMVFGDVKIGYVLDEPEDSEARMFVDANNDGDFTNDAAVEWVANDSTKTYFGSATVELGDGKTGKVNFYRFNPSDPKRESLKNTLLYYSDFGYELAINLDGTEYSAFTTGTISAIKSLPLDRDKNGSISYNYEMVEIGKPFNFTGTSYELVVDGETLNLRKSEIEIPQTPLPPNLTVGQKALEFTASTTDGTEINFPKSFAGKLVMLDFWAMWCGPCIGEIPNMKEAYAAHHDNGFEILGISFDYENEEEKLDAFTTERDMPWPQIYEGKGWETTLGKMHDVSGIPFVLLVDGDTGEILATARELRGEGLKDLIGRMLEKRAATESGDSKE